MILFSDFNVFLSTKIYFSGLQATEPKNFPTVVWDLWHGFLIKRRLIHISAIESKLVSLLVLLIIIN